MLTGSSVHSAGSAQMGSSRPSASADRANLSGKIWYITVDFAHSGGSG
jgi:hypothetical protein